MSDFTIRLREEIQNQGLKHRELATMANVKKRALDMYLGCRESMPPADAAVRLAQALGVSVEYLVTGKRIGSEECSKYLQFKDILDDLLVLSPEVLNSLRTMIHALALEEREKNQEQASAG